MLAVLQGRDVWGEQEARAWSQQPALVLSSGYAMETKAKTLVLIMALSSSGDLGILMDPSDPQFLLL